AIEKWFARALDVCSGEAVQFLATEKDQFRNPVGYALRENLAVLLREVVGEFDLSAAKPALEAILRVRAVQDLTATQATGFIFLLRPIMRELMPEFDGVLLDRRIDQLALIAFEEYVRCREQLAEIRLNESRRAMAVPAAMSRVR
ncbi:MAG: hypothetical protein EHM35_06245, partial [Planctomycetaceae bacterium]